jgi:opacity protein-like surface antigen
MAWEGSNFTVGNSINIAGTTVAVNAGGSGTQTGGLLGMGVEYAFLPKWSAKLEHNYTGFGTRSFNASIAANPAFAGAGPHANQASISLNGRLPALCRRVIRLITSSARFGSRRIMRS